MVLVKKMRKQFGQKGEQLALNHLRQHGYAIVTTNWRCAHGEIDIVARQQAILVFVEVRSRHSHTTETAFASIDETKRSKLYACAHAYLHANDLEDTLWRIDVIAIAVPRDGPPIVEQVENALDW